jgi:hypothetical protein
MKDFKMVVGVVVLVGAFLFMVHGCTKSLDEAFKIMAENERAEKEKFFKQCQEDHKQYECKIMWKSAK